MDAPFILADYSANVSATGSVGLTIESYSQAEWDRVHPNGLDATDGWKRITIAGREGELLRKPAGTRPVGHAVLAIDFGETVVAADASSGGSRADGGPDVNPLIDEATFLAVMQNLRPYPE